MSRYGARAAGAGAPGGALRFCMITTFYPPLNFGGDGISVQRLARGLTRRGHHVTVVHDADAYNTLHEGPEPAIPTEDDGVEVVRLRSVLGALSPLLTQQTGRPIVNARRIRSIIAGGRFDVVNFHNVSLVGGAGVLSLAGGLPTLYTAHEHWLVCPTHVLYRHRREPCPARECVRCTLHYRRPPQLWRATSFLARQLDAVDTFVARSEFSRAKHHEFGFPREMEVLPDFLPDPAPETVAVRRPHDRPYFLFVGRLEQIKGLDDVVPLFRDFPDADLLIAGDGDHAPALRALAAGNPRVRFLGFQTQEALRAYYRHAIALVVPSQCFETFGLIVIEAFRERTPVLARRLGPFPEMLAQSDGGELFTTPDELLGGMRRLCGDVGHRARLGAAGYRAYLDRWSEGVVIPQYLGIVERTTERAARRRGAVGGGAPARRELARGALVG